MSASLAGTGNLGAHPTTRFRLSAERTATEPPEQRGLRRDGVRLLVASGASIGHTTFARLDEQLRAGDVLVVNTSATVPGQLDGRRGDRPVVVHLANRLGSGQVVVELRSAPLASTPVLDGQVGEQVSLPAGATVRLDTPYPTQGSSPTGSGNRLWRGSVTVPGRLADYLLTHARPISYGYLRDRYPLESYQTVFALTPGSAEMPSAGRPFTAELVARLVSRGVLFAPVTLHTGVSSPDAGEEPQAEWFAVPAATARLVNSARAHGGRVVAVGTTATRALESAAGPDGTLTPTAGWTDLVVSPERPVRVVGGLITGWHHPDASHLLLVEAVAGSELTQQAYDTAVAEHYRWHEFGDSGLLLP